MAKIMVPATLLIAKSQKTSKQVIKTHGIMTLKAPNLYTNRVGSTRPIALAALRTAIYVQSSISYIKSKRKRNYCVKSQMRSYPVFNCF